MGLEKIRDDIEQNAKKEVASIQRMLKKEIAKINAKRDADISELESVANRRLKAELDAIKKREAASVEALTQKALILGKKEALSVCYDEAFKRICVLDTRKKIAQSLLKKAQKQIDVYYVHTAKEDASIVPKGLQHKIASIRGGVICETKDAALLVNCSFEVIFEEVKEHTMAQTAEVLFTK
ncbi:hypothetical protein H6504_05420 [Candidatus Woesearchaeota archaeon]|nr:hypothetical protein [Candidatus Woesearchaeota archaeon]